MNFSFLLQATPEASTQKTTTTYQSVWDIIDKSTFADFGNIRKGPVDKDSFGRRP